MTVAKRPSRIGTKLSAAAVVALVVGAATAADDLSAAAATPDPSTAGAGRIIELRPNRIDLTVHGQVVRSIPKPAGTATLDDLRRWIGNSDWLRESRSGVYELAAAIYQAPGTDLSVAAPQVRQLLLLDQSAPRATWLRGSRATARFAGVTVLGWDAAKGGLAKPSTVRPYVSYTNASSVSISDTTFAALGRPGSDTTGVSLLKGTAGAVTGSWFQANQQGLTLDRPGSVTLRRVTAISSVAAGLVLRGGHHLHLRSVTTSGNRGSGIELSKSGVGNKLDGVQTFRNGGAGVAARDQQGLVLATVSTGDNGDAGVSIRSSRNTSVSGWRADGEQRGLYAGPGSRGLRISKGTVSGGGTGIRTDLGSADVAITTMAITGARDFGFDLAGSGLTVSSSQVDRTVTGLQLRDQTSMATVSSLQLAHVSTGVAVRGLAHGVKLSRVSVSDAGDSAVAIAGSGVSVTDLAAADVATGVDVYGRATGVTIEHPVIRRAAVGILATGTTRSLQVRNARVSQQMGIGLSSSSPALRVAGGRYNGARLGLDLHGSSSVTGARVSATGDAVRVGAGIRVALTKATLLSSGRGVRVAPGGHAELQDSVVTGSPGLSGNVTMRGQNTVPPQPTPWLGIAAATAITAALVLEVLRRVREHEADRKVIAPVHVARPT